MARHWLSTSGSKVRGLAEIFLRLHQKPPVLRAFCAGVEVMDLGLWLRTLGLEQYEAAFRENA
jgi:hypothetical protein